MGFYIIDAFSEQAFGGNPAGVVLLSKGETFPTEELMQQTAAELRYSETAFILPKGEGVFQIRYFTPEAEVDLCGHATIASFVALQDVELVSWDGAYAIETLAGNLGVTIEKGLIFMDMAIPVSMGVVDKQTELDEIYGIMGLSRLDMAVVGKNWTLYPEFVSTGLPDLMLPVANTRVLGDMEPDFPALSRWSETHNVVGVHAFTLGENVTAHCRNFAPFVGINEEAATGTSNGALTYYLYKNGLLEAGADCTYIQGEAMNRPSKILGRITDEEEIKIQIGGYGVILAKGDLRI